MAVDANGCEIAKIDSNVTGLSFAEEQCLKELPVTPVWYDLAPNSYSDFGGELTTVARSPIDPSRQNKKGTVTDLDASGGFNIDYTKTNLLRLMQGFFFADARAPWSSAPLNAAAVPITGVIASSKTYTIAGATVAANQLLFAEGFTNAANNGLKTVASATGTTVVVTETLVDETPAASAKLTRVGHAFALADVSIAVVGNLVSLVSVAADFTTMTDLFPGKWVFLGGDGAGNHFVNNVGFARISAIAAHSLTFDDVSWAVPANEAGAGLSIKMFTGVAIRNEKNPALIKQRSYNIERTLGEGETDTQAEYLEGAVPNEFTLNIPQADKLNADLTFVACSNEYRSGDVGDARKTGTHIPASGEDAYNTSSDIYRLKMSIVDPVDSTPSPLFGYVSEASVSINNNVSPVKAVGILGSFATSLGNFEVGGSITAYFTTTAAVKAIRANADVGLSIIGAAKNSAFVFDVPLLGLGGGRLAVEKDQPITVPLEPAGAENKNGYTMLYQYFPYVPTLAMP